jgi:hypothetical protein
MTQTHTPGPWKTGTREFTDEVFEAAAHGKDWGGWLICETGGNAANAAFIVRACNAHDELVKALEIAVPELVAYYGKDHFAVAVCKQALALAQQP